MARTLPPNKVLLMENCHFRGTPLDPGFPEFALHVPQGTFSGRLEEPGFTAMDEEDFDKMFEDERAVFKDDDEAGIGVIVARPLELLLRIGVMAGRLELDDV